MQNTRQVKHRIVRFKSQTEAGKFHLTERMPDGKIFCTCKGWEFRRECRHTKAAANWK